MPPLIDRARRTATFKDQHPEWADMAAELLFRRQKGDVDIQYAVAQALMAAFEMGQRGTYPPRPKGMEPRRFEEPPPDPETDAIYQEMRMLAWSPLAGTPRPEGHVKWSINRSMLARKPAMGNPAKVVVRTRPGPVAAPTVKLIRRSR